LSAVKRLITAELVAANKPALNKALATCVAIAQADLIAANKESDIKMQRAQRKERDESLAATNKIEAERVAKEHAKRHARQVYDQRATRPPDKHW
jgi:hypothetical protein